MRAERFDWDTSRRVLVPGRAPAALKVLLWTLAILIGVPAILYGIGAVACLILLGGS